MAKSMSEQEYAAIFPQGYAEYQQDMASGHAHMAPWGPRPSDEVQAYLAGQVKKQFSQPVRPEDIKVTVVNGKYMISAPGLGTKGPFKDMKSTLTYVNQLIYHPEIYQKAPKAFPRGPGGVRFPQEDRSVVSPGKGNVAPAGLSGMQVSGWIPFKEGKTGEGLPQRSSYKGVRR